MSTSCRGDIITILTPSVSAGVTRCELGPLLPATAYQVAVYSQNTVGAAEYLHIYSIDTISTHLQMEYLLICVSRLAWASRRWL